MVCKYRYFLANGISIAIRRSDKTYFIKSGGVEIIGRINKGEKGSIRKKPFSRIGIIAIIKKGQFLFIALPKKVGNGEKSNRGKIHIFNTQATGHICDGDVVITTLQLIKEAGGVSLVIEGIMIRLETSICCELECSDSAFAGVRHVRSQWQGKCTLDGDFFAFAERRSVLIIICRSGGQEVVLAELYIILEWEGEGPTSISVNDYFTNKFTALTSGIWAAVIFYSENFHSLSWFAGSGNYLVIGCIYSWGCFLKIGGAFKEDAGRVIADKSVMLHVDLSNTITEVDAGSIMSDVVGFTRSIATNQVLASSITDDNTCKFIACNQGFREISPDSIPLDGTMSRIIFDDYAATLPGALGRKAGKGINSSATMVDDVAFQYATNNAGVSLIQINTVVREVSDFQSIYFCVVRLHK